MKIRTIVVLLITCIFIDLGYYRLKSYAVNAEAEEGQIVIKSLLSNPSTLRSQKLPFKTYLARGVTSEHIVDAGDLEIDFDYVKGQYFAHNEYILKPGEEKVVKLVLVDIWRVQDEAFQELKSKFEELADQLDGSKDERFKTGKSYLKNTFEEIEENLRNVPYSPVSAQMKHFSELTELLKYADYLIRNMGKLAGEIAQEPKTEKLDKLGTSKIDWRIITTVIVLLAVLSTVFFYLWFTKINVKRASSSKNFVRVKQAADPAIEPVKVQKIASKKDKKLDINDLEDLLKKKKAS